MSRDRNWSHNQPPEQSHHQSEPQSQPQNIHCLWCKTPYGYKPGIPHGAISHGICPGCADTHFPGINLKEMYHELAMINEDYTFEPTKDTHLPAMSARHMMTQLPGQKRKDLMKPYRFTKDKSSARSDRLRKRYRNKNRKNAKPFSRLPYGF